MIKQRPRIIYTTSLPFWNVLDLSIRLSIWLAGGSPVRVTEKTQRFDEAYDGLVVGGGTDIHPDHYGGAVKKNYPYEPDRDRIEMAWIERATKDQKPVLGICRGAQLMNVVRGGTLHYDISKVYEKAQYPTGLIAKFLFRKHVDTEPASSLCAAVKREHMMVNSIHSQSIDELGKGLVISAREKNGIVQAIEDPKHPYYIGVQYHPEILQHRKHHRALFVRLVTRCNK